ncbi:DUF4355 domain-containing protein [Bifidobacterium adolescentis]|nr:DUF4355 domain-containing protein [Bifidobacterium pseudocatenulatum]RGL55005.1 DUF4355 domain-containing protein [Bifidobacterium adolescentis]RGL58338.1 DUF4355 domain-containing protein [Bifidobacterium adolescentis]RGL67270.1 DUF4355 domain-containing protein [Bifidobacterium adolescentis]
MRRIAWEDHTAHRGAVELESTGNSKKEHDMFNRFRFPARVRLIDGGSGEGGSGEGGSGEGNEPEPKSFTQEQVDQIVERRLAKERGKYKDYDELKSKAMRLDEMENAGKSELDKLKESNAALRKQIDDAAAEKQHAEWVSEVAKDKGVPAELLRGSTKDELEAHADLLQAALHPASKPPQVRNQTGSPSHQNNSKDAEELSYIHQLLGR